MDSNSQISGPIETSGFEAPSLRDAAYVLGRNIWFLGGWLSAVNFIASTPQSTWEWLPPQEIFGESFAVPPVEVATELDGALLRLVHARAVDATILVELHRALDAAIDKCVSIAELAQFDQRYELTELYFSASYDLLCARRLNKEVLTRQVRSLEDWRHFGDLLGETLYWFVGGFHPAEIPELVADFTQVGQRLLPAGSMDELGCLYSATISETLDLDEFPSWSALQNKFISLTKSLDNRVTEQIRSVTSEKPYLVLDDERERVTFLGATIPFEQFREQNAHRRAHFTADTYPTSRKSIPWRGTN